MTTKEGQLVWAKRARGMANSVAANERRRGREPTVIDWDERIANLHDILDDTLWGGQCPEDGASSEV
jgi:hypothetical protein